MHTMTAVAASAPPKLPVWQTDRASYAIVARNLGQLVRICWLWVLIMVPVHAALDWLEEIWSGESDAQATYHWMREITAALPVDLPFVASIAVGWHRLVLREERVTQPAYLRLDGVVWRYVLYSFASLLLERGTLVICAFLVQILPSKRTFHSAPGRIARHSDRHRRCNGHWPPGAAAALAGNAGRGCRRAALAAPRWRRRGLRKLSLIVRMA